MRSLRAHALATLAGLSLAGCKGFIFAPHGGSGGASSGVSCTGVCLGVSALPRITTIEYQNSVMDVFGIAAAGGSMPGDGAIGGSFFSNDQNPLADGDVDLYRQTAEQVADTLVTAPGVLDQLLAPLAAVCGPPGAACADAFAARYGSRLYRRPLTDAELADYRALYAWTVTPASDTLFATGGSGVFVDGIRYIVEKMLASPGFLYRVEVGTPTDDPNVRALNSQEMATRLGAYLLRSVPDAELTAAVAQDALTTPEQISAQVHRLLSGSTGDRMWKAFAHDWISTQQIASSAAKSVDNAPANWSDAVVQGLEADVEGTFTHLVQSDGTLHTLMTSAGGVIQGDSLQWLVGVTGTPGSWMALMPHRNGLLTWPGLIIANGNPGFTHAHFRGLWVRGKLLCQSIGSPPADLAAAIANAQASEENVPSAPTDRERMYGLSEVNPTCASCHHYTNPIGYGLDAYDDLGRYRTTQIGVDGKTYPIDASGQLQGRPDGELATDVDGAFANGTDLINRLADSATVARCMETQMARFALQREVAVEDRSALDAMFPTFEASGRDLRQLAVMLTATDAFRNRRLTGP